jgi:hypothetical protein
MKDLTRRSFLTRSSIGFAFAAALGLVAGMAGVTKLQLAGPRAGARTAVAGGPFIAHVRDLATGEIAFLVGSERFIIRDRDLAVRLHSAAWSR